ncbi:MAG: flagellin lysine-N-methylase [Bacilli bacterium]
MGNKYFIVPDYYPSFRCKCGKCRNCCCYGWLITMDESEYFSLQDLDVSSGLKEKIEGYVSPLPDSTPERYGRINLDFEGQCPLRQKSGLCGLQVEKGEAVLPSICRQYPRSPRLHPIPSATISDSCEWVLENICLDKEKLRRISYPLSFEKIDEEAGKDLPASFVQTTDQILLLLSDRSLSFSRRILSVLSLFGCDMSLLGMEKGILSSLYAAYRKSYSLSELISGLDSSASYEEEEKEILEKLPDFDLYREKILSNHVLYMLYPNVKESIPFSVSAFGLYFLDRMAVSFLYEKRGSLTFEKMVDILSLLFRVTEHSNFYLLVSKEILLLEEKK